MSTPETESVREKFERMTMAALVEEEQRIHRGKRCAQNIGALKRYNTRLALLHAEIERRTHAAISEQPK